MVRVVVVVTGCCSFAGGSGSDESSQNFSSSLWLCHCLGGGFWFGEVGEVGWDFGCDWRMADQDGSPYGEVYPLHSACAMGDVNGVWKS